MPTKKKLSDKEIDALMQEFRTQRGRVPIFCAEKGIPVPTFRRWLKEWQEKQREVRLAALPEKPLAWMPPEDMGGRSGDHPTRDPVLTMMVDLADNLGPHTGQAIELSVCCDGLVVSGRLIGAQEYFAGMKPLILAGATGLLNKYKQESEKALERCLPDTERLPERREEWDDFYEPDEYRDSPEFIHLAEATIYNSGSHTHVHFWRGKLANVTSFWTEPMS